jgi:predicted glycosyltransferase
VVNPRIVLYSHDALGMGHMRRNLAVAGALSRGVRGSALLLTGSHQAAALPLPRGVEVLTLPAIRKATDGSYHPRSLHVPLDALLRLRAETICAALDVFTPDVLIADKHPLGLRGELAPAVRHLRDSGRTRLVLGLRDVLDEPEAVRAEWERDGTADAIAGLYDEVWVYGDPAVYDPVAEYDLAPIVAAKVRYTGYLAPAPVRAAAPSSADELGLPPGRLAVCTVGGGQDGEELARAFARAPLPDGMGAVLVAGPFMPGAARRELHALAAERSRLRVLDFVPDPVALLARAHCVVAMGGYNTVCELLALRRPALVVPRTVPRREQLIRAERLAELGLIDVLRPERLRPEALGAWLAGGGARRADPRTGLDFDGLTRLPGLLGDLLDHATESTDVLVA